MPVIELGEGAAYLPNIFAGVVLTFVGALNSSSPQVQRENFQMIRETSPEEVGTITIWMSSGDETAPASVTNGADRTTGGASPPEGRVPPPEIREREMKLTKQQGGPVFIPTSMNDLRFLMASEESFRDEPYVKYMVVGRPDNSLEFRICDRHSVHVGLVLLDEQIVAAGQMRIRGDSISVNGDSSAVPTSADQAVFGAEYQDLAPFYQIAPISGLSIARNFLNTFFGGGVSIE